MGVGMSPGEQRAHFALWCLLKSPLLVSADLRTISREALAILQARELLAVNQDGLGVAGDLLWKEGPLEVRALELMPRGLFRGPAWFEWSLGPCGSWCRLK